MFFDPHGIMVIKISLCWQIIINVCFVINLKFWIPSRCSRDITDCLPPYFSKQQSPFKKENFPPPPPPPGNYFPGNVGYIYCIRGIPSNDGVYLGRIPQSDSQKECMAGSWGQAGLEEFCPLTASITPREVHAVRGGGSCSTGSCRKGSSKGRDMMSTGGGVKLFYRILQKRQLQRKG